MDIVASINSVPGTFEELQKRDFLQGRSEIGLWMLVKVAMSEKLINEKRDLKYYCTSQGRDALRKNGYEI